MREVNRAACESSEWQQGDKEIVLTSLLKEQCLDYVRRLGQQADIQVLDADIDELKLIGDVAVVVERTTAKYEVRGQTYRDTGRTTWVLVRDAGRWLVSHSHLESLAPNRIVDPGISAPCWS